MKELFLLLLFRHVSSTERHSLKFFLTLSPGVQNFPEFMASAQVDDVIVGHCDTNTKTVKVNYDWVKDYLKDNPDHLEWYSSECSHLLSQILSNHDQVSLLGGLIVQMRSGCEWDEDSGETTTFVQFGLNGEDIVFDKQTETLLKTDDDIIKQKFSDDLLKDDRIFTNECPASLKLSVQYGRSLLQRTVLPSVSLLQKTPSSLVSCHATGFYPDRALVFWTKDGEEFYEDVGQGEILPNHDGTFQMTVDLDVSSVKAEDWRRYDCVFLLSGVKDDIVTKLDKALIRTNMGKAPPSEFPTAAVVGGVVVLLLLLVLCVSGFIIWRQRQMEASDLQTVQTLHLQGIQLQTDHPVTVTA